jgi:hypothetical protein
MQMALDITNGPSKADLLRSVTNASEGLTVTLETTEGPLEVQMESLKEGPTGVDFTISGFATSPTRRGLRFGGTYNVEKKAGRLDFGDLA